MKKPTAGGPWGLGLALAGAGCGLYGSAYVAPVPGDEIPAPLVAISEYIPLWVWGGLWVVAGVWSVFRGFRPPHRVRDALPLILVTHAWGSAYMAWWAYQGIANGEWTRDWRGWILFGTVSTLLIVWSRLVNPPALLHLTASPETACQVPRAGDET